MKTLFLSSQTSVSSAQVSTSSAVPSSSSGNGKTGSNGSKGLVSQAGISQGQATPLIGGKPVFSTQAVPSLLVGQIGKYIKIITPNNKDLLQLSIFIY